jgi:DNA-binding NarL/FixJ family response regulator
VAPVRVFHGDDNESYRFLVRECLPDGDLAVVGDAGDPDAIVDGVQRAQPDVVLLDQLGGGELVERIRAAAPGVRVIVLSGYHPGDGDPGLAAGADGYVVKAADFDAVRTAVLGG